MAQLCGSLGASHALCTALERIGVPLLVRALAAGVPPGATCQQLGVCDAPAPSSRRPLVCFILFVYFVSIFLLVFVCLYVCIFYLFVFCLFLYCLLKNDNREVPRYTLDLDLAPERRWVKLFEDNAKIRDGVIKILSAVRSVLPAEAQELLADAGAQVYSHLSAEYRGEIDGMATALNIQKELLAIFQAAYDLSDCTSLVANQPSTGHVVHARNLGNLLLFANER